MKLRTVLSELDVTRFTIGPNVNLDAEVIVLPLMDAKDSFPELLVLAAQGRRHPNAGFAGITLIFCGSDSTDVAEGPDVRCIHVMTNASYEDFHHAFARLPQLHVHLDLQRKRIYDAFQSSYDLQHYAERVSEILGNPLMIVNSDRRLLASAGDLPEDRADVQEVITQGSVSEEVSAELEHDGISDDVRHAGHSIISENKCFGQRWVTSIISYHHMDMGRLHMLEQVSAVRDSDLELVDFAGSLAGVMIDRLGVAGERAGAGSTVLDDLLTASFTNEKNMRAQLALSSMPLDETYVLMSLVGECEVPRAHLQRIAAQVRHAFRNSLWIARDGGLTVLVALGVRTCPGWDAYKRASRVLGQHKEFVNTLERNGLRAFVSEPFEQVVCAPDRYQQVRDLINAHVRDTGPIVYFWKHRYAVLASMARTFRLADMMLDKRVVAMRRYDNDHGTAYLETACRTVEHPGSPAEAAKALNVHRNTYFYRVNKIDELFYLDLKNGDDRLAVAFFMHFTSGMGNQLIFDAKNTSLGW